MKFKLIITFFIFSTVSIIISILIYRLTIVKKLIIISDYSDIKGIQLLENQNLMFINETRVTNQILSSNINIKKAEVQKVFPGTIILHLTSRVAVAKVNNEKTNAYIDEEGIYLTQIEASADLPVMEISKLPIYSNSKADWRVVKAVALLENLINQNIKIKGISIDDNQNMYIFTIGEDTKVYIPYNSDAPKLAASLQIIISRFRIEGKSINLVDFRYDKPVIVLSNEVKKSSLIN